MVQPVHRALGLFKGRGYFNRREAGDVAKDQHLALVLGKLRKRLAQVATAVDADLGADPLSAIRTSSVGMARVRADGQAQRCGPPA